MEVLLATENAWPDMWLGEGIGKRKLLRSMYEYRVTTGGRMKQFKSDGLLDAVRQLSKQTCMPQKV